MLDILIVILFAAWLGGFRWQFNSLGFNCCHHRFTYSPFSLNFMKEQSSNPLRPCKVCRLPKDPATVCPNHQSVEGHCFDCGRSFSGTHNWHCKSGNNQGEIRPAPQTKPNPPHINHEKCECNMCNPEPSQEKAENIIKHQNNIVRICDRCGINEIEGIMGVCFDCFAKSKHIQDKAGKKCESCEKGIKCYRCNSICLPPQPESEGVEMLKDPVHAFQKFIRFDDKCRVPHFFVGFETGSLERFFIDLLQAQAKQIRRKERERVGETINEYRLDLISKFVETPTRADLRIYKELKEIIEDQYFRKGYLEGLNIGISYLQEAQAKILNDKNDE